MKEIMNSLFSGGYWPVLLTVSAYLFAVWLQKKTKLTIMNPILIGGLVVILVLWITGVPVETYREGVQPLSYLLTPATICLALSLYDEIRVLKGNLPAILVGVVSGTVVSILSVLGLCLLFGVEKPLTVSMLPKSVTTAIGVALSEEAGGIPALTAAVIVLTGLFGNLLGPVMCRLFRITDQTARGVAYGTASHVIGTSRAVLEDPLTAAVSSLSLVIAGLITAVLFPVVMEII